MFLIRRHEIYLALSLIIIQIAVKSVASNLSYENTNYVKINQDPSRFQQASGYRNNKHNYAHNYLSNATTSSESNKINTYTITRYARNYSQDKYKIGYNHDKNFPKTSQIKKWQVGRVSRKQYEIINMLWRKTKIFGDVESTTAKYLLRHHNDTIRNIRQPFFRFTSRPSLPSTTLSFIEFYYLDETDERIKELLTKKHAQASTMREHLIRNHGNHKFVLSDSPMFSFHIRDANYKRPELTSQYTHVTNNIKRRKARTRDSPLTGFRSLSSQTPSHKFRGQQKKFLNNSRTTIKPTPNAVTSTISTTNEYIYDNETCPTTVYISFDTDSIANITSDTLNVTQIQESTTAYDKIKFFEMYDKLTPVPCYDEKGRYDMDNVDFDVMKENEVDHQVRLEHVDQSIGNEHSQPHKAKPAKKHIIDNYKMESNNQNNANSVVESKTTVKPAKLDILNEAHSSVIVPNVPKQNVTKQTIIKLLQSESIAPQLLEHKKSQNVEWSQYPFAAAYVYEPLQVHCDAGGISSHWLITSGSCLSRHHKNPSGEGRSAFVTYCGVAWWNPERVAYVKYSLVHPRFNPRDKTRRHLYNIGLIQVVNSMASACNGWSSISLMSHQIVAEGYGSTAKAVGWGLDRFDTRYSSSDLPKSPLSSYENRVFSHSCPGNVEYDKAKRLDEEGGIKNVYCLTLPPYLGEAIDPVHGGLLLVGGKLVALYLQEERRPWGDQSAQYTGTWRLVPWILDIARENDDADTFTLEI